MNQRKKQQRLFTTIVSIMVIALVASGVLGYLFYTQKVTSNKLKADLEANTLSVYVASTYIAGGDTIVADGETPNVVRQQIRTGLDSSFYISEAELGQSALVDIAEGTPVMYAMVTADEFDKDTRNYEISVANLMTTQMNNDFVDVRIMFPNGEDYIILSHKKLNNLVLETNVFTCQANEEEILRMSSAIIDAYCTTGAYIYTTTYVASDAQEAATPTYPVKAETLELINSDPNVLTKAIETLNLSARISLETRLSNLSQEELEAVAGGLQISDTAGGAVLQSQSSLNAVQSDESEEAIEEEQ